MNALQWKKLHTYINDKKLQIFDANNNLQNSYEILKLEEDTISDKYKEFFGGQKRSYIQNHINYNWNQWIRGEATRACDEFIVHHKKLDQIINDIRTTILLH